MYGHPNLNQPRFQMKEGLFYLLRFFLGGVSKSMLTLNEAIIDVKKG